MSRLELKRQQHGRVGSNDWHRRTALILLYSTTRNEIKSNHLSHCYFPQFQRAHAQSSGSVFSPHVTLFSPHRGFKPAGRSEASAEGACTWVSAAAAHNRWLSETALDKGLNLSLSKQASPSQNRCYRPQPFGKGSNSSWDRKYILQRGARSAQLQNTSPGTTPCTSKGQNTAL